MFFGDICQSLQVPTPIASHALQRSEDLSYLVSLNVHHDSPSQSHQRAVHRENCRNSHYNLHTVFLKPRPDADELPPVHGPAAVISGSCSTATLAQIAAMRATHCVFDVDPLAIAEGRPVVERALEWAAQRLDEKPLLISASAPPDGFAHRKSSAWSTTQALLRHRRRGRWHHSYCVKWWDCRFYRYAVRVVRVLLFNFFGAQPELQSSQKDIGKAGSLRQLLVSGDLRPPRILVATSALGDGAPNVSGRSVRSGRISV